jgi:hypothetical protein
MAEKEQAKEKDVEQVVRYLTATFNKAKAGSERAFRGKTIGPNETYVMETEFAYLINDVMQGPRCLLQKHIAMCNDFIDQVMTHTTAKKTTEDAPAKQ